MPNDNTDLYQQHDPDPPPPPDEGPDAAPELSTERRRGGGKRTENPSPAALKKRRQREGKKAAADAPARPAPAVAADAATQSTAQVVLTLNDLSPEQKRAREIMLGYLSFGWAQGTAKLLGFPLARPSDPVSAAAFDELVKARPDVGMTAMQWDAWLVAFDLVAIKHGWYKEMPAEWALVVSTLALAGCVVGVWFTNRKAEAARREEAAQEQAQAQAAATLAPEAAGAGEQGAMA